MDLKHSFSLYSELFVINLLLWFMFQSLWAASLLPNKTVSSVKSDTRPDFSVLPLAPGKGNGNLLQYSCLENPMARGAWQATVRHNLATKPPPLPPLAPRMLNSTSHVLDTQFNISLFKAFRTLPLTGISSLKRAGQSQGLVSTQQAIFQGSRHKSPYQFPSVPSCSEGQDHKTRERMKVQYSVVPPLVL